MIFRSTYSKPILLAGNGIRTSGAVKLLHEFAKKTNIPVLTTMNAVDLAQDDLHIGFIGTHGNRVANMIIKECDVIISIGARLGIRQAGKDTRNFAPQADLIRCDIDEYELARTIKEDERKYHSDARDFLQMLLNEDIPDYSEWKNKCLEAKKLLESYDKQPGNMAVEKISSLLPESPVVSVDVGMNQCWCAQSLHLKGYEGRIHISGGYGTMGCGLPFAIGSSIAQGKAKSFCVTGDGGFQGYGQTGSGTDYLRFCQARICPGGRSDRRIPCQPDGSVRGDPGGDEAGSRLLWEKEAPRHNRQ